MSEEKVRILIVDDHEENLVALTEVLNGLNLDITKAYSGRETLQEYFDSNINLSLDITKAHSGREALRDCVNSDFALILLDVVMPDMDGFETALQLRKHMRFLYTPIIFLSAYAKSEEEMFRGYSLGAIDYIIKPYDSNVLKAKVLRFIELHNLTALLVRHTEEIKLTSEKLKQSLAEARELKSHLEMSNKQLDAFSYSVSHDLRAPLRHIAGFSQELQEKYADKIEDDGKDCLARIRNGAQRMEELIEDLLALSRVTRAEIQRRKVDLSALGSAIIDELRREEPVRRVEFVVPSTLPVNGDEHLLRMALQNLLGNSWKFTSNRPEARIELGCTKVKGKPAYFVRDNGAGFDMKYADKLFTPFQRLHSTEEFPGTGIGLSMVQRIMTRHGGNVWGEGAVDQGATFYFTLGEVKGGSRNLGEKHEKG